MASPTIPAGFRIGDTITWTIRVDQFPEGQTDEVTLEDTLPAGHSLLAWNFSTEGNITATVQTLPAPPLQVIRVW